MQSSSSSSSSTTTTTTTATTSLSEGGMIATTNTANNVSESRNLIWTVAESKTMFQTHRLWPSFIGVNFDHEKKGSKGRLPVMLWAEQKSYLMDQHPDFAGHEQRELSASAAVAIANSSSSSSSGGSRKRKLDMVDGTATTGGGEAEYDEEGRPLKKKTRSTELVTQVITAVADTTLSYLKYFFTVTPVSAETAAAHEQHLQRMEENRGGGQTLSLISGTNSSGGGGGSGLITSVLSALNRFGSNSYSSSDIRSTGTGSSSSSSSGGGQRSPEMTALSMQQRVFSSLQARGYFIGPGDVYGGDFTVYRGGDPSNSHSTATVRVVRQRKMTARDLLSFSRVQNQVAKSAVLAFIDPISQRPEFLVVNFKSVSDRA